MSPRADWFRDSIFHLHYDHHVGPDDDPPAATAADPAQIKRLLERVRPESVTYHAKGHPGWATYPSNIAQRLPAVDGEERQDLLRIYREVTRELGIRFVVYVSGLVDHQVMEHRPMWARVDVNGLAYTDARRSLCPNQPYVTEHLMPLLAEIITEYQPDGIWMDGENWSVRSCHCDRCISEYTERVGDDPPYSEYDERWRQWLRFHRDCFISYVEQIASFVHARAPECVYCTNTGYNTSQPEIALDEVDRLSWDLSPAFAARQASMEARFLGTRGKPFDLVTWNQCSARPWGRGRVPTYPKRLDHMLQEGAVILANGGRWTVWVSPNSDDALPEQQHETVAQAAEFARARREVCLGTESVPCVGVLHGAASHYTDGGGNGLFDAGAALDRIRGAHQALMELHLPFEIHNEISLRRRLRRLALVVLPEQAAIEPDLANALREYVSRGGRLLATGPVAGIREDPTNVMAGDERFLLQDVLGVRATGDIDGQGYAPHAGATLHFGAAVWRVDLCGARQATPLLRTLHSEAQEPIGHAAVTEHEFGEGRAVYLAPEIFAAYRRHQYPGLRDFLGEALRRLLPEAPLRTDAPPEIEVVYRRREGERIVHLVNHAPDRALFGNASHLERVPPTAPFEVHVTLPSRPQRIRIEPADPVREAHWNWAAGVATIQAPAFHVHMALVIELEEADAGLVTLS